MSKGTDHSGDCSCFPTTEQKLAMINEVRTAVRLLQLGFRELQAIDGANDFYHLPFLLLSSGFERLMKCIICLKRLCDTGGFPSTRDIKTHDLAKLLNVVVRECISKKTAFERVATRDDYEYMGQDEDLRKLLSILSDFGKFSRYYNLDVVTGNVRATVDVEEKWSQYETDLVTSNQELSAVQQDPRRLDDLFCRINRIILAKLERFARALVRQFTLGDIAREGKMHTGTITCFLFLTDEQLGRTSYR